MTAKTQVTPLLTFRTHCDCNTTPSTSDTWKCCADCGCHTSRQGCFKCTCGKLRAPAQLDESFVTGLVCQACGDMAHRECQPAARLAGEWLCDSCIECEPHERITPESLAVRQIVPQMRKCNTCRNEFTQLDRIQAHWRAAKFSETCGAASSMTVFNAHELWFCHCKSQSAMCGVFTKETALKGHRSKLRQLQRVAGTKRSAAAEPEIPPPPPRALERSHSTTSKSSSPAHSVSPPPAKQRIVSAPAVSKLSSPTAKQARLMLERSPSPPLMVLRDVLQKVCSPTSQKDIFQRCMGLMEENHIATPDVLHFISDEEFEEMIGTESIGIKATMRRFRAAIKQ